MKKILLSVSLLSILVLGACSVQDNSNDSVSKTSISKKGASSNKEEESGKFDASDYLVIDTKSIKDSDGENYKLSKMVKSVVGTYSGVNTSTSDNNYLTIYQLRINEDGTYVKLSRPMIIIPDGMDYNHNNIYFDSSDNIKTVAHQRSNLNGHTVVEQNKYTLERGVLVEKFGKLHLVSLHYVSNPDTGRYIDLDGEINLEKDLIVSTISPRSENIPTTSEYFQKYVETEFDYNKEFEVSEVSDTYILDGKIMIENTELSKSEKVESLVSKNLDEIITEKSVKDVFSDLNGVLQYHIVHFGFDEPLDEFVEFTDYSKIYRESGENADVKRAILNKNSKNIIVYYDNKISEAYEENGTFVLRDY